VEVRVTTPNVPLSGEPFLCFSRAQTKQLSPQFSSSVNHLGKSSWLSTFGLSTSIFEHSSTSGDGNGDNGSIQKMTCKSLFFYFSTWTEIVRGNRTETVVVTASIRCFQDESVSS
jgi:hypothetical protein